MATCNPGFPQAYCAVPAQNRLLNQGLVGVGRGVVKNRAPTNNPFQSLTKTDVWARGREKTQKLFTAESFFFPLLFFLPYVFSP